MASNHEVVQPREAPMNGHNSFQSRSSANWRVWPGANGGTRGGGSGRYQAAGGGRYPKTNADSAGPLATNGSARNGHTSNNNNERNNDNDGDASCNSHNNYSSNNNNNNNSSSSSSKRIDNTRTAKRNGRRGFRAVQELAVQDDAAANGHDDAGDDGTSAAPRGREVDYNKAGPSGRQTFKDADRQVHSTSKRASLLPNPALPANAATNRAASDTNLRGGGEEEQGGGGGGGGSPGVSREAQPAAQTNDSMSGSFSILRAVREARASCQSSSSSSSFAAGPSGNRQSSYRGGGAQDNNHNNNKTCPTRSNYSSSRQHQNNDRKCSREAPPEQTIEVDLAHRLSKVALIGDEADMKTKLDKLKHIMKNEQADMLVMSADNVATLVHKELAACVSSYFEAISRSGMIENRSNEVKTRVPHVYLRAIFDFVYTGAIKLTNDNVVALFHVAHYFQMDALVDTCCRYILDRVDTFVCVCLEIGYSYSRTDLADAGVAAVCADTRRLKDPDFSLRLNIELFEFILLRDDINVTSEDEVCEFVFTWLEATERSESEIERAINCIRIPHITQKMATRLSEFVVNQEITNLKLCLGGGYTELPEEQLQPRDHYAVHMHVLWRDELHYQHGPVHLNTTCLRFLRNRIIGNSVLDSIPGRGYSTNCEFLVAGERILRITQSTEDTKVIVQTLEKNGYLKQRATFVRESTVNADFAACARGPLCVVSFFNGFGIPPKFNAFNVATGEVTEDYYQLPGAKMRFSPREMGFFDDFVVILRNQTMILYSCDDKSVAELSLPEKMGYNQFTCFIRIDDDKLLVYEDCNGGYAEAHKDRIHIINLKTKEFEGNVQLKYRLTSQRSHQEASSVRTRKLFTYGKRIYALIHDQYETDGYIFRLDMERRRFCKPISISMRNVKSTTEDIHSRRYILHMPLYFHKCRHETIMQAYLHGLSGSERIEKLAKLKRYL